MAKFTPVIKKIETKESQTNPRQSGNLKKVKNFLQEKKFVEALGETEVILQNNPSSLQAHLIAGKLKARQKLNEDALHHFLTAIKINPKNIQAYLRAGRIYYGQKKYDAARKVFQAAIKQDSKNPLPYAALAQVSLKQQKYDEAEQNFTQAIRLNPRFIAGRKGLALTCKKQKKYDEAIGYFNSILTIQSDNSAAYIGIGRIHLLEKRYAQAKEAYQQAIKIKSSLSSSVYMGLAEALIEENELESAKEILTKISENSQLGARLQKLWGDLYTRQGLYKQAAEAYQAALLLGADESSEIDQLEDIDILKEMDDSQWEELAKSYSVTVKQKVEEVREKVNS